MWCLPTDAGRIMNPKLAAGQIVGGAVMAQGYALMEDINSVKGYAKNENFDQYMIPGIKRCGQGFAGNSRKSQ